MKARYGSVPFRTELGTPMDDWLTSGMTRAMNKVPVKMRNTGGSQPMAPFVQVLNIPAVSLRIPNPDNSIHAPNENFRIGNYKEGIMSVLGVLTENIN